MRVRTRPVCCVLRMRQGRQTNGCPGTLAYVALFCAPSFPLTQSLWLSEVEDKRHGSWGRTKKVKVKNLYSKFGRPTLMRSTEGNKIAEVLLSNIE